ncbi:MAG: DUF3047 domain-containing protein [Pseudomonadota bacterium]
MPRVRSLVAGFAALAVFAALGAAYSAAAEQAPRRFPVSQFRVVERESGPVNYYTVFNHADPPFIHAEYHPPLETTVLGVQVPDADRAQAHGLGWRWRAVKLPKGGNECESGKGDSAAVVYVSWRRTLRWYALKYVWSAVGPKGATCDRKSNPFAAQDTVVLESGAPLNEWTTEHIDLKAEFRRHFEHGDPNASVPDFMGVGLMSDGDQTHSESSADYADFVLER